jgi:hypothetical protein
MSNNVVQGNGLGVGLINPSPNAMHTPSTKEAGIFYSLIRHDEAKQEKTRQQEMTNLIQFPGSSSFPFCLNHDPNNNPDPDPYPKSNSYPNRRL